MSIHPSLFSSDSTEWATPHDLFDRLAAEFAFTLDAAATTENAKCARFFTAADDGLAQEWTGSVWCNPPFGRGVDKWTAKARASAEAGALVVMLLPARTDTRWFQRDILGVAEIRFLPGRLRFVGAPASAPFPSVIVVWRPGAVRIPLSEALLLAEANDLRDELAAARERIAELEAENARSMAALEVMVRVSGEVA